jgi:5,10-methylenetetrahydrofolate reductase
LEPFRARHRILVGVMLLTSHEQAQRIAQVPGVVLPDAILQRFAAVASLADQAKVGQEIAAEQIRRVRREGWAGLYLMSPGGANGVLEVLRAGLEG